jgi:hypothetical protein
MCINVIHNTQQDACNEKKSLALYRENKEALGLNYKINLVHNFCYLTQNKHQWKEGSCEHGNKLPGSIKCWKLLE